MAHVRVIRVKLRPATDEGRITAPAQLLHG